MKTLLIIIYLSIPIFLLLAVVKWIRNYRRANRKLALDRKREEAQRAESDRLYQMKLRQFKRNRK